jgi:23S rRNA pseudouridine1911/1915/1917 synthase
MPRALGDRTEQGGTGRRDASGRGAWRQRFTVGAERAGERLDRLLAELVPDLSRTRLQTWIKDGCVSVGGTVVTRPGTELEPGDTIELVRPKAPGAAVAQEVTGELDVLFEDEHLAAIDKPAGMLTHATADVAVGTVADLAVRRFGPLPSAQGEGRPGIVHRLDRFTSGVMVLGRTEPALAELMRQFKQRSVAKTYAALVHGSPRFDTEWIEAPIGRPPARRERHEVVAEGGRTASTYYEVRERFHGFALVACYPKTGRTHQVRVHMAHIGLPLVGDKVYRQRGAVSIPVPRAAPLLERQELHAARLELAHPASGERLAFEAPLPSDIATLVAWLREHMPER